MDDLTPTDHAAEAEHWLNCAASQWAQGERESAAGALAQMATGHALLALRQDDPQSVGAAVGRAVQAGRPIPDSEVVRRAVNAETERLAQLAADQTEEVARLRSEAEDAWSRLKAAEDDRDGTTQQALRFKAVLTRLVAEVKGLAAAEPLPESLRLALTEAEALVVGEPVPSTGEDQGEGEGHDNRGPVAEALGLLGAAYRGDWSDFDGRTLRGQLDELAGALTAPDPFDAARWAAATGICPDRRAWAEHCGAAIDAGSCMHIRAILAGYRPVPDEGSRDDAR